MKNKWLGKLRAHILLFSLHHNDLIANLNKATLFIIYIEFKQLLNFFFFLSSIFSVVQDLQSNHIFFLLSH